MKPTARCSDYILHIRCCLVIVLFIPQYNYSQNYIFQHLTTKDGLASEFTKYIFQDSKGFYWIGYDNGFQKFDGKNFITSSFDARYIVGATRDLPATLPVEDKAGSVYIFNQGSVFVFHLKGNVDTIRIFDDENKAVASIASVCKDDQDNIWLATPTNLYRYEKKKNNLFNGYIQAQEELSAVRPECSMIPHCTVSGLQKTAICSLLIRQQKKLHSL